MEQQEARKSGFFSQATLYTEENSSQMPGECLAGGGGGWGGKIGGLELTGIF